MKFLAYSAGGGLIAGIFLLLVSQTSQSSVSSPAELPPQEVTDPVNFAKVPLVNLPKEIKNAR